MNVEELIKLKSHEVRSNADLMAIYISAFEEKFGYKPNCAGCTFNSDFQKLKNAFTNHSFQQSKTITIMEKTFQLRQVKGDILTYKKEGKAIRQYDNRMTEDFAVGFLTYGTQEEIEHRKKLFKKLPKELTVKNKEVETVAPVTKPKRNRSTKK